MNKPDIFELQNGLKYLTYKTNGKTCIILLLINVGSRYEKKGYNGISHLIEHMMFKGTKKRPNTLSIVKELDAIGAEYNAFTSKNLTGYWIKAVKKYLPLLCDIISDMIFNSLLENKEIIKEKKVVIQELVADMENPSRYVVELFENILFSGNLLSNNIGGEIKDVQNLNKKKIIRFINEYYFPKNMLLSIGGNFNKNIHTLIRKHFNIKDTRNSIIPITPFICKQNKPQLLFHHRDLKQTNLCIGYPTFGYLDKRYHTLMVMNTILGSGMSSRLFINLRERNGLAYHVRSFIENFRDTGYILIKAGVKKNKLCPSVNIIFKEINKIKNKRISQKEIKKAIESLKGSYILSSEDMADVSKSFGEDYILLNKTYIYTDLVRNLNKVTPAKIQKLAKEIFKTSCCNIACLGNVSSQQQKNIYKYLK